MVHVPGMWLSEYSRMTCRSGLGRHGLIWNCECEATKAGYIFSGPFVNDISIGEHEVLVVLY
jgi:hypothetical protein